MTKTNVLLILIISILMCFSTPIFAHTETESTKTETTTEVTSTPKPNLSVNDIIGEDTTGGVTSTEEVFGRVETKLYGIVSGAQKVITPILVICLILVFVTATIGFVTGGKHLVAYAMGGLLLIGFAYVGIMFAPEILEFFKTFLTE